MGSRRILRLFVIKLAQYKYVPALVIGEALARDNFGFESKMGLGLHSAVGTQGGALMWVSAVHLASPPLAPALHCFDFTVSQSNKVLPLSPNSRPGAFKRSMV